MKENGATDAHQFSNYPLRAYALTLQFQRRNTVSNGIFCSAPLSSIFSHQRRDRPDVSFVPLVLGKSQTILSRFLIATLAIIPCHSTARANCLSLYLLHPVDSRLSFFLGLSCSQAFLSSLSNREEVITGEPSNV